MPVTPPASELTPWYRQLWPWLLISMPALAVVGGAITLWLAITSNHALVVDDYYREGRAINLTIARDQESVRMGLRAVLRDAPEGLQLTLQAGTPDQELPATLRLRLVHATEAALDRTLTLQALGRGHYVAGGERLPSAGRWSVHVEDPALRWRLITGTGPLLAPIEINGGTP